MCIPWSGAHVKTGRKDRQLWEDHNKFLTGLQSIIQRSETPLIITGDFNQRIPRIQQPLESFKLLSQIVSDLKVLTLELSDRHLIDHVVCSRNLVVENIKIIENSDDIGQLSDHRGVISDLKVNDKFP